MRAKFQNNSRRNFLKQSVTGIVSGISLPAFFKKEENTVPDFKLPWKSSVHSIHIL